MSGCGLAPLSRGQKWPADLGEVVHAAAQRVINTPSPSPGNPAMGLLPGIIFVVDPRHCWRAGRRLEADRHSKALIELGGIRPLRAGPGPGPAQVAAPDNLSCRTGGDPDQHYASGRDLDLGAFCSRTGSSAFISCSWGAARRGASVGRAA